MDISKLDPQVLEDIRENQPQLTDKGLALLSPREAFKAWCTWHGFLGWSDKIADAYESIMEACK